MNRDGFESEFSDKITAVELKVQPHTKDILVLTNAVSNYLHIANVDSIKSFYNSILTGYNYDIFDIDDSVRNNGCNLCMNLQTFLPYKYVIIDNDLDDESLKSQNLDYTLTQYLLTGGKVLYFGSLNWLNYDTYHHTTAYYEENNPFINRYFGIDSIFYTDIGYYKMTSDSPFVDTSFGFISAEPVDSGFPLLTFDTLRDPFISILYRLWPANTAPAVATFRENSSGQVIYRYRSLYPSSSRLNYEPVGIKTITDSTETYLFGFHLWYMEQASARQLVKFIVEGTPTDINESQPNSLPNKIVLKQNYPNPFNPTTSISFELPKKSKVSLEVYNVLGKKVTTLIDNEIMTAGIHKVEWDGKNHLHRKVASGLYFYRLRTDDNSLTKKMMLLK